MALHYIEPDGKTVRNVKMPYDNELDQARIFQIHPDQNPLLRKDKVTGRYVYEFNGEIRNL